MLSKKSICAFALSSFALSLGHSASAFSGEGYSSPSHKQSSYRGHGHHGKTKLPQLSAAQGLTLVTQCEAFADALTYQNLVVSDVTTVSAGEVTIGGTSVGEHCLVTGSMNERVSEVDGNSYAIGFELRLPKDWNGRFLHQGNGGLDGNIRTAVGALGGGPITGALSQGFAVISSNAGHGRGLPTFGYDPQARLDYGYQAVATLTPMAKSLIQQVYGKEPDRSYFAGCSNGGRHAMVAAARYGNEYDGILAGAPGYNLPRAAVANIAGAQVYASIPDTDINDLETAFTAQERLLVSNAVLSRCDALDGVADGMVQNYRACQKRFDIHYDVPSCNDTRDGSCLTLEQKNAIDTIFSGVETSRGEKVYSSFPYDAGISNSDQLLWEYSAPISRDSGAVAMIFKTPPVALEDFNIRNFDGADFVWNADIDTLFEEIYAANDLYTESGMSFMTPPTPEDLSTLRDRGGKIMVYHGVSDAIFSVDDSQAWYDKLNRMNRGKASKFARFYPVAGMGHCRGGQSTDQFDMLTPLVNWVEYGERPDAVIATARGVDNAGGENTELPDAWSENRTRPLCPYPQVAKYQGGDVESAESFACVGKRGRKQGGWRY